MGGGASHEQQEEFNKRLEKIEGQLDRLAAGGGGPIPPNGDAPSDRKRSGPFSAAPNDSDGGGGETSSGGKKKHAAFVVPGGDDGGSTNHTPSPPKPKATVLAPRTSIDMGLPSSRKPPVDKKELAAAKAKREKFFSPMIEPNNRWDNMPQMGGVKCVWLNCAALAISYVSGLEITLEDILKRNEMALHYVSFPSVTLAELCDIATEYVEGDTRMKSHDVRVEMATFETIGFEDPDDHMDTGERGPILSLAQFRKEMQYEQANSNSLYIFNYNPFLVQEAEATQAALDDDENEEGTPASPLSPRQWQPKNMGQFSLLTAYNPALHAVTLASPHLGPDNKFRLETHTCTLQTLYEACSFKDGYTKRPRGFLRVFRADATHEKPIKSSFPIATLDGRNTKGQLSIALDINIAPHLLGLGLLHHLVTSSFLADFSKNRKAAAAGANASGKMKTVELTGIMVTHICEVLKLPVSQIAAGSTPDSLAVACAWYQRYLSLTGCSEQVHVGHVPIQRRDNSEDGALNVDEEEFFAAVLNAVTSDSLMLISFDINVAQNAQLVPQQDATHFAVVVGADEHRGVVKLADVSVKKYRKTWHLPLMRLHTAAIGYGYMLVSNKASDVEGLNGLTQAKELLPMARYNLPPPSKVHSFEFPRKNYSITALAHVLTRLGFTTTVEDLLYGSGFHLSFLLSEHVPMLDAARILRYYSHTHLDDAVDVLTTNFDTDESMPLEPFQAVLKGVVAEAEPTFQVVVFYDAATIQKHPQVWNGSAGGNKAIVVGYRTEGTSKPMVTLLDTNPDSFFRQWECPVDLLHKACHVKDRIPDRARGFLRVSKQKATHYEMPKPVDMRTAMSHHPFKPVISAAASAIALTFSELQDTPYSSEDVLYSNPTFTLSKLTSALTVQEVIDIAKSFVQATGIKANISKLSDGFPSSLTSKLKEGFSDKKSLDIVLYDVSKLFGATLAQSSAIGAGVVGDITSNNRIVVVDGNPTRFGGTWDQSADKLESSALGVVRISF